MIIVYRYLISKTNTKWASSYIYDICTQKAAYSISPCPSLRFENLPFFNK